MDDLLSLQFGSNSSQNKSNPFQGMGTNIINQGTGVQKQTQQIISPTQSQQMNKYILN